MFVWRGWLLDPVYPATVVLLMYLTQSAAGLSAHGIGTRAASAHQFGITSPPTVVEQLARDPERLQLGGETREMTMHVLRHPRLHLDLGELDAGRLTPLHQPLPDADDGDRSIAQRGTIDKYMGDAIMAFWNAPLDDPDHADNAAKAALAMLEELDASQRRAGRPRRARTGGNSRRSRSASASTPALAASATWARTQRFDYTVIGDDVNLASRLEGQSQDLRRADRARREHAPHASEASR